MAGQLPGKQIVNKFMFFFVLLCYEIRICMQAARTIGYKYVHGGLNTKIRLGLSIGLCLRLGFQLGVRLGLG